MAARNKPAGIRVLVYGMGKGKAVIEGLCVSDLDQAEHEGFLGRFLECLGCFHRQAAVFQLRALLHLPAILIREASGPKRGVRVFPKGGHAETVRMKVRIRPFVSTIIPRCLFCPVERQL